MYNLIVIKTTIDMNNMEFMYNLITMKTTIYMKKNYIIVDEQFNHDENNN